MYEKQNWKNGEVITQDKLNHLENGVATGGGIYEYIEVTAYDGEVTTTKGQSDVEAWSSALAMSEDLPKQDISVTFNGQEYTLPFHNADDHCCYGEEDVDHYPVFTNYPLYIYIYNDGEKNVTSIATLDAGTYSVEIQVKKLVLSEDLQGLFPKIMILHDSSSSNYLDKTGGEIKTAFDNDYIIVLKSESNNRMSYLTMVTPEEIYFIYFNGPNELITKHFTYSNPNDYPEWDGVLGD